MRSPFLIRYEKCESPPLIRYEKCCIAFGVKVADGNVGFANNIYTMPHFCAFLIKDWLSRK